MGHTRLKSCTVYLKRHGYALHIKNLMSRYEHYIPDKMEQKAVIKVKYKIVPPMPYYLGLPLQ